MPGFAFVGKGGSGKSTLAGTFSRLVARRDHEVLALDADHVAGLATALGLPLTDDTMLYDAVTIDESNGRTTLTGSVEETIQRHAAVGPDGVRFLQFGKLDAPMQREQQASSMALRHIADRPGQDRVVVVDLAAGTRQAYFGWTGSADTVISVLTPSQKAVFTARRLLPLARSLPDARHVLVLNDVRSADEVAATERMLEPHGLTLTASLPHDPSVAAAARKGIGPLDHDPSSPFVVAVDALVDELLLDEPGATATVATQAPEGTR